MNLDTVRLVAKVERMVGDHIDDLGEMIREGKLDHIEIDRLLRRAAQEWRNRAAVMEESA